MQTYEGERDEQNRRHGVGKAVLGNGDVYEGEYFEGVRQGRGRYTWTNGNVYVGEYHGGVKSGQGTLVYKNGAVYSGQWAEDRRHGEGKYKYPNGDVYVGAWAKGVKHGDGRYRYKATGTVYTGQWVGGQQQGQGQLVLPNDVRYVGEFSDDLPSGEGAFFFPGGNTLEGTYEVKRALGEDEEEEEELDPEDEDYVKPKMVAEWKAAEWAQDHLDDEVEDLPTLSDAKALTNSLDELTVLEKQAVIKKLSSGPTADRKQMLKLFMADSKDDLVAALKASAAPPILA